MAIMAINRFETPNRIYNNTFTGKPNKGKNAGTGNSSRSSLLASVPVMLMLLPTVGTNANAQIPTDKEPKVVQVVPQPEDVETGGTIPASDLYVGGVMEPPLGVAFLSRRKVQSIMPIMANGLRVNLVYTKYKNSGEPNEVQDVYLVTHGSKNIWAEPPLVTELVLHETKEGSFLGAVLEINEYAEGEQSPYRTKIQEVKISVPGDDDLNNNPLVALVLNEGWLDKTGIGFKVVNNSELVSKIVFNQEK